jgi:hypothetical protein
MSFLDDITNKAKEVAGGHEDAIKGGIDKLEDMIPGEADNAVLDQVKHALGGQDKPAE